MGAPSVSEPDASARRQSRSATHARGKGTVTTLDETRLVGFMEAVFSLEIDDRQWLEQVLSALAGLCGRDLQYRGFFYDASDVSRLKLWNACASHTSPDLDAALELLAQHADAELVTSAFRSLHVGSLRQASSARMAPVLARIEAAGFGDWFYVNGLDASGLGCMLLIASRERELAPSAADLRVYRRLATNLASAFRCRRRLGVLSSDSSAEAKPSEEIQARFAEVVGAVEEHLRTSASTLPAPADGKKRSSRRPAIDLGHATSRAHLTLVHTFEENGSRYIVARENDAQSQGIEALTGRERQIVEHATSGFTNKQIAYNLGISDATVRVLMARAASRIGVRTRRELLAHPALSEIRAAAAARANEPESRRAMP